MKIKRFKTYLREGKYPLWVRFTLGGLVLKVKNLEMQINSTSDTEEQNKLISKQNVLLSYISGLSVAVSSTDKALLKRLKNITIK